MHEFYREKKDIIAWLEQYEVQGYTLIEDNEYGWVVDVEGRVFLNNKKLDSIKVKFNKVSSNFEIDDNKLTSLLGCPHTIDGTFNCSKNKLKSLIGGPVKGITSYFCDLNELTELIGAPSIVDSHFMCSDNKLKSLRNGPVKVKHNYFATDNQIETLEFFPQGVGLGIFLADNPLLGAAQSITNYEELLKIHLFHKTAAQEKMDLDSAINEVSSSANDNKNYKI